MTNFPLEGVGALPNVSIAFPGEHWSNGIASGQITPGEAIVPVASAAETPIYRTATNTDTALAQQIALAMNVVQEPDVNTGPGALGPNEIVNQPIAHGEYVSRRLSGAFNLTLVDPRRTYTVGSILGWDADGERPVGKSGVGSWAPNANADIGNVLEVMRVRKYGDEYMLTVRFVGRSQF
jgi:hypothetical protein